MSDSVISVESLGKRYRIKHQQVRQKHATLRDVLADRTKSLARRLWSLAKNQKTESRKQKSVEDFWALRDVSFEVKQGETLGIIGRNGAGKSTLLKILSRITEPTEGRVRIKGRVASLLEVGTGFHPELTGRENIFLNGAVLGMHRAEIKRKFDEIVAFAEVEKFLDTPVKRYSSGMYVRLAFAVAAHLEPEILIVDEVLAVGDAQFQKKCLGKMGDVAKNQGRTVLFVSHNMQAINNLCCSATLLSSGRIEKSGAVASVVNAYLGSVLGDGSDGLEREWSSKEVAPGNDRIRLRRIAIKPEQDDGGRLIEMTTAFRIEVDYWNLAVLARLHLNLGLYTLDGSPAFETVSSNAGTSPSKSFPKGLFRSVCKIPANLLNEGTFRIRLLFVSDSAAHLYDNHEAATFTVHDTADRRLMWYGRYHGPVHPNLIWSTECLRSEE